jgi:hypothetical protein
MAWKKGVGLHSSQLVLFIPITCLRLLTKIPNHAFYQMNWWRRRYVYFMRLGNILAGIGIILGFLGFICLPFWNLRELPYLTDPGYPRGGGWILLVQTGLFARPGILLMVLGGLIYLSAKLLPKKY